MAEDASLRELARVRASRLHALIEVLYATGLRVSELVALPVRQSAARRAIFTVRGKGGHERIVPLTDKARAATAAYLARRKEPAVPTAVGCSPRSARAAI